ncbi:unnamed protein product [Lactuca virosa]|uniref:Knottin scorpion toxin-like domain-containing protein n=1 Tax=Lactuca virosa TaxID=75947 RepID=A0AAU9MPB5_9ASTR|nr:unnamed protein product [Lactuca virosa]
MKTSKSSKFPTLLLILLLFSACATTTMVFGVAHGIRIPEHVCKKTISMRKCEVRGCEDKCSKKEPFGVGKCSGNMCICSYYCELPPM